MAASQGVTIKADEYPFVLVVDDHNDFAFYYAGTMTQDGMAKSLMNLECIMREDVAIVFDNELHLYRLSTLKSAMTLAGERYNLLCRTTYEVNHGDIDLANVSTNGCKDGNVGRATSQDTTTDVGSEKECQPRIPRPRNQWIIYRQNRSRQLHEEDPTLTAGQISTIVSTMWRRESREVKDYFKNLAEEEDRQHKAKYPQYKYQARKSGINKRKHQQVSA
ncbi:high mobility group box domain-containing protein [Phialemonium atrogriseum]|uniref:High mobility group box domain-containing protein n=1 Tax=Phialemonium atrogriseum TaxID=1093897 RepID=A0AAJ0FQ94_9PEZI|nr:high mobility group box domain-containing protein [Phialemonium atrogriseum]KAK1768930.1 high mobility group box domain-containing protein [Phialemonium atrogriseum]